MPVENWMRIYRNMQEHLSVRLADRRQKETLIIYILVPTNVGLNLDISNTFLLCSDPAIYLCFIGNNIEESII